MARGVLRTYLFADLRDYTPFVETRGDIAATQLIRAFRRLFRAEIKSNRGAEIKTEGDSFYVVFRTPGDAVRCAVGVMRRAKRHSERHPDFPLRAAIGINTGEAVKHEKGYVGSAVIVAARLAAQAEAGRILATETVRSLIRTGAVAPMRDLGSWQLKGVAQSVHVFEVEIEASRAAAPRSLGPAMRLPGLLLLPPLRGATGLVVCPELVQRELPLASLLEHLGAAATGHSRLVALTGEAGVGKSRLCRELARLAHDDGFYVFGGRSHDAALPYGPFVAALRPYAQARGTEILKRLLGTLTAELRRLLPELEVPGAPDNSAIPDEERRDRFLRTIHLLLEDAASLRPVLLVLEDFHEADSASRDLLRYLATTLHGGILVIFTYRDEDVGLNHPLRALLTDLDHERRLVTITVSRLDPAGVARMTAAMLPERANDALARAVYDRSEGLPFYVEELLKTAVDDPDATADRLQLPRTVRDSVQMRVARLAEQRGRPAAELLEAAAVANVPLRHDVLVGLSGRGAREAGEDLGAAVAAQLLERTLTQTEMYQFRHALTRDAIASAITPSRRSQLSRRVAEALEKLGADPSRAPLLARLFAAGGETAKAVRYAREGAAAATRVGAHVAAIDLLRDTAKIAVGRAEEADVLEELAAALQAAGRAAEAEGALLRARDLFRDDTRRARVDMRLAAVLRMQGNRVDAKTAVLRAISQLERRPGPLLAEALVRNADLAWAEQDLPETASLAQKALAVARAYRSRNVEAEAMTLLGAAEARLGRDEAIAHLEDAVRLGSEHGLMAETVNAHLELSRALLFLGRNQAALEPLRAGLELARTNGLEFVQARLLANATTMCVNLGRYAEARAFAEQAVALAPADTVAFSAARMALAHVMSDQGEGETALAIYEQIGPEAERNEPDRRMIYWSYRAQCLLGLGRLDEAMLAAKKAVDLTMSVPGMGMTAFLNAAEVAEARRDTAWIDELAADLAYFAGVDTAPIRLVRLEIAAVSELCHGGAAAERFDDVVRAYESLDARVRATYRRASAAAARLARPSERTKARREVRLQRAQLIAYGALRYVIALDATLNRRSVTRARARGPFTSRDERVAALVSQGLTDRRIAAELRIAPSQVTRVVRSLGKRLGVTTRSQIARWADTRGVGASVTGSAR